jgi:Family of unknown function (DUF6364)
MNTKLTLTLDETIIEKAKKVAKKNGRSLSNLIENYLKIISNESKAKAKDTELTPIVKSLKGSFKAPSGFNYKDELSKRLSKKYL